MFDYLQSSIYLTPLILAILMGMRIFVVKNRVVRLTGQGLVLESSGSELLRLSWIEIAECRFHPSSSSPSVTLVTTSGLKHVIKPVHPHDQWLLVREIQTQILSYEIPQVLAAIEQQGFAHIGPLSVSWNGISYKSQVIGWDDFSSIMMSPDVVRFESTDSVDNIFLPTAVISNHLSLVALQAYTFARLGYLSGRGVTPTAFSTHERLSNSQLLQENLPASEQESESRIQHLCDSWCRVSIPFDDLELHCFLHARPLTDAIDARPTSENLIGGRLTIVRFAFQLFSNQVRLAHQERQGNAATDSFHDEA